MRVTGVIWDSQAPSSVLRQACSFSATLFGLSSNGLHHDIKVAAVAKLFTWLRELVVPDDIRLMVSFLEHLQTIIGSLSLKNATLQLESGALNLPLVWKHHQPRIYVCHQLSWCLSLSMSGLGVLLMVLDLQVQCSISQGLLRSLIQCLWGGA